jgi:hypothetical protein
MNEAQQRRWLREHSERVELMRSLTPGGRVFNRHYGWGELLDEWGTWEDNGAIFSGRGVFEVRFAGGKIHPINADNLVASPVARKRITT